MLLRSEKKDRRRGIIEKPTFLKEGVVMSRDAWGRLRALGVHDVKFIPLWGNVSDLCKTKANNRKDKEVLY